MAISVVQAKGATRSGSGANFALTFTSNVSSGNRIVATVSRWQGGSGQGTVTDSLGNTYTRHTGTSTSANEVVSIWSAVSGSSGACTVTFTPPAATFIGMGIAEVSGTSAVGGAQSTSDVSLGVININGGITLAKEAILFGNIRGSGAATITPMPGWTQIYEDETFTNVPNSHIYQIVTDYAGPWAPCWRVTAAAWNVASVAFESTTDLTMNPTKVYLGNISAPYTPATIRGTWNSTGAAQTKGLVTDPATGGVTASGLVSESSATNPFDFLMYRGISPPLNAQTISGTVQSFMGVYTNSASALFSWHVHLYCTQGDSDTPRGTLLNDYTDGAGVNEFTAGLNNVDVHGFSSPQTLSSLGVAAGDRLVAEIGFRARNSVTTTFQCTHRWGTATAGAVALADNCLWSNNSWSGNFAPFLLFSNPITFGGTAGPGAVLQVMVSP